MAQVADAEEAQEKAPPELAVELVPVPIAAVPQKSMPAVNMGGYTYTKAGRSTLKAMPRVRLWSTPLSKSFNRMCTMCTWYCAEAALIPWPIFAASASSRRRTTYAWPFLMQW